MDEDTTEPLDAMYVCHRFAVALCIHLWIVTVYVDHGKYLSLF